MGGVGGGGEEWRERRGERGVEGEVGRDWIGGRGWEG